MHTNSADTARETIIESKTPLSTEESDHALALKLQRQLDFEQDGGLAEAAMSSTTKLADALGIVRVPAKPGRRRRHEEPHPDLSEGGEE